MTLAEDSAGAPAGPAPAFSALNLSVDVLRALAEVGLAQPRPLQATAIRHRATGRDLLLHAPKASGMTTALVIGALDHLLPADAPAGRPPRRGLGVIVVCPSRTHARAAGALAHALGVRCRLKTTTLHSGGSVSRQAASLTSASLVVGTPDRLLTHLQSGALRLDAVGLLIFDEADEVLSLGLGADLAALMAHLPEERQTVLGTAALAPELLPWALRHLRDPAVVEFGAR